MNANGWLQLAIYLVVLLLLVKPLGLYMAGVFDGTARRDALLRRRSSAALYRLCRIDAERADELEAVRARACWLFNALGALAVYALQRLQACLPWNPQQMSAVSADSSFNTAVSFATNTNWQGYGGESTMSYLTQMLGARRAELPVGGHRHRGAGRPDPRLRAQAGAARSAISGSI